MTTVFRFVFVGFVSYIYTRYVCTYAEVAQREGTALPPLCRRVHYVLCHPVVAVVIMVCSLTQSVERNGRLVLELAMAAW